MSCNSKEGKRIKKREGYKWMDGGNGEGGVEIASRAGQGMTGSSSKGNDAHSWLEGREGRQRRT